MAMKEQIEAALLSGGSYNVGTVIAAQPRGVRQVMIEGGLIGPNGGLTRQGSILAERLKSAQLDRLFG